MLKSSDRQLANLSLFTLLFLFTMIVALIYSHSEKTFYAGDFAPVYYHNNVQLVVNAWRQSPFQAMVGIWQSLGRDHSQLFVIPLLPLLLILGDSRVNFILSVGVVYLFPLSLVLGAIAPRLLITSNPQFTFWLTAFVSLLVPATWLPTLRGYPDAGGLLAISGAIFLVVSASSLSQNSGDRAIPLFRPLLNQISGGKIVIIGFLLGFAMLFRRHFAYADLAFITGLIVQGIAAIFVSQKRLMPELLLLGGKLILLGSIAFLTLIVPAQEFTIRALTTDFRSLYAAWSLPFPEIFWHYFNFYGGVTWVLVITGFTWGISSRSIHLSSGIFIATMGIISLVNLLIILRYDSFQYTLHITPIIIWGLVFLFVSINRKFSNKRKLITTIAGIYLGVNFLFMLTGLGKFNLPLRSLIAANYPPQVRQDYEQIQQLVRYLREIAPNKEPIYVVSSSAMDLLSRGVLANAEATMFDRLPILNFLRPQSFDSSSSYPLESLLKAQYVVVPQVMEYRFAVEQHRVARITHEIFTKEIDKWALAADFRPLSRKFTLENGSGVTIYQRLRPTSLDVAVQSLGRMQQEIPTIPGGQADWITLSQFPLTLQPKSPLIYQLTARAGYRSQPPITAVIFLTPVPPILRATGAVKFLDPRCGGVALRLAVYDQAGKILSSTETLKSPSFPPEFFLATTTQGGRYLVWQVLSPDDRNLIDRCTIEINDFNLGLNFSRSQ
ncbi:MAG: hypothetical protein HC916_12065 [Coleofasciculaceae cyanobacterium SM2_1_6]|nr:hypothetical protein [Coleofasciculaceae cyanobacterium SM2_1_6]